MKKLLFVFLAIILFISNSPVIEAQSKSKLEKSIDDNYQVKFLINTATYQKVEFTNLTNGEVEYLETHLQEDGEFEYTATDPDNEEILIENNGEEILLIDEQDNVVETIKIEEDSDTTDLNLTASETLLKRHGGYYITASLYRDVPKKSPWGTYDKYRTSSDIKVAYISLLAGILASVAGGPVTGVVTSVATFYLGIKAKKSYYHVTKQTRFNNGRQVRRIVKYYKYHDYTKYLGTYNGPAKNVCFTCLN